MQKIYKDAVIRIRKLRKMRGMTRVELGEKCNVTEKFIYEIEAGRKGFSAATLYDISNVLGVCSDYILTGEKLERHIMKQLAYIQLFESEDNLDNSLRLFYDLISKKN